MTKLRFGLIGAGGIAQTYAQAFAASTCCELNGIADVRFDAVAALAETASCAAFSDHESLADNTELDAVIIATPPVLHKDIACYFLDRGIPVLCEKPLCLSEAEALAILETAERSGLKFAMASKFRYCDDVIRAKGILASGVLGEIVQFENSFTSNVDMSARWNSKKEISGGGVMIDNGTHSVDIIRYLFGPINEVLAVEAGNIHGLSVDENVKMFAKTVSGVIASVDLTWGINKELPYFLSIHGRNGTLHVGWRESKYKLNSSPDWTVFGSGYDKIAAFRAKIENFAGTVKGNEQLLIGPDDALASVRVIEAAYRSLEANHWQKVNEPAKSASA